MRVKFENTVLTVVTNIPEVTAKKGFADLTVSNDKKELVYSVSTSNNNEGKLSKFGMAANAVIEGNLAVVIPCGAVATQEDIMRQYGEALIAANQYTAHIAAAATEKEAVIAGFFAE